MCQLCNSSACAPVDPPSRGDGVAGLPGHCPCRAPAATSVTPVTQHRQRPGKRSAPPFIAEIPAFAETFGCYSYPFLPRKPYVPRYWDGSRLQVRNVFRATAALPPLGRGHPGPVDGAWGIRTLSGPRDLRAKRQLTRKSHQSVTTTRWVRFTRVTYGASVVPSAWRAERIPPDARHLPRTADLGPRTADCEPRTAEGP